MRKTQKHVLGPMSYNNPIFILHEVKKEKADLSGNLPTPKPQLSPGVFSPERGGL